MAKQSPGFSVVELVVVAVIVLAAGLGGWYVWQRNQGDGAGKQSTLSRSSSQKDDSSGNKQEAAPDPSEGGKYMIIQEWGVRFMLPEELRGDVKYGISTLSNGDQAVHFASNKIAARSTGGACDITPLSDSSGRRSLGGTIAVGRSKVRPEPLDQRSFQNAEYWYTLSFGNAGACYPGDTGQEKGEFNTQIESAVKQLESVR